jgi:hypothetical protein
MAHFARIENDVVRQVITVSNPELVDDGNESEAKGIQFCRDTFGANTTWVQTSYNGNPINGQDRGPFAAIGFTWDGCKFVAPVAPQSAE